MVSVYGNDGAKWSARGHYFNSVHEWGQISDWVSVRISRWHVVHRAATDSIFLIFPIDGGAGRLYVRDQRKALNVRRRI